MNFYGSIGTGTVSPSDRRSGNRRLADRCSRHAELVVVIKGITSLDTPVRRVVTTVGRTAFQRALLTVPPVSAKSPKNKSLQANALQSADCHSFRHCCYLDCDIFPFPFRLPAAVGIVFVV